MVVPNSSPRSREQGSVEAGLTISLSLMVCGRTQPLEQDTLSCPPAGTGMRESRFPVRPAASILDERSQTRGGLRLTSCASWRGSGTHGTLDHLVDVVNVASAELACQCDGESWLRS